MNRQRGFVMLIVYAVMAVAALGALYALKNAVYDHIGKPYAEAQRLADQKVVDRAEREQRAAESERDNAISDTVACVSQAAKQSEQVDRWKSAADRNAVAAREARAQAQREATAAAPKIADLQAKAAAAPKLMACEEELARAKDVLRDALRTRRGLPTGPAK